MEQALKVRHVYEHDVDKFEKNVNEAIRRVLEEGGVIGDIKYVSDAANETDKRGGFGALIIYELEPTDS